MKNTSSKITLLLLFATALLFAGCATPLMNAAKKGDTKEMERLIAAGANVNESSSEGGTPLHQAAASGHVEVVRLLIKNGADVNALFNVPYNPVSQNPSSGISNFTPLHEAAASGHVEVARLLIENGADPNIRLSASFSSPLSGSTPLDYAKKQGHTSVVSLLEKVKLKPQLYAAETEPSNPAEEAAFTEAARSYREAAVKPTLPEEARKFKVQAEFAVSKKDFVNAVSRYKEALDVAPWWPEGYFNRALILGELSRYHDAIREMKRYLTLVPDAPNARAAQDKIYQWEGELK